MLLILFVLVSQISFGQTDGDTKIIITINDKAGMYEKVKIALVKNDFIVKDDAHYGFLKKDISAPPTYSYKQSLAYYDSARYLRNNANKLADSLIDKIPKDNRLMKEIFGLGTMSKKVKFKKVTIKKNETANNVIDFGVTYY